MAPQTLQTRSDNRDGRNLYPWLGYQATDHITVWGVGGACLHTGIGVGGS